MYSTGEKLVNSIIASIKNTIIHLEMPIAVGVMFFAILLLILRLKYKDDFRSKVDLKRVLVYCASVIYIAFLLEITLIQRIGIEQEPPFSKVLEGWSIFKTNKKMYLDFGPIINCLVMIPMAFVTKYAFRIKDKYVAKTVLLSFGASCAIEICQIIFRLGTFQISDLVYNTISGLIGCIIIIVIDKYIINKKAL